MKNVTKKARNCMLKHSILAAGGCGVFKAIVPIPKAEVGALTCTTMNMCKKIAHIYGYDHLSGLTQLIGVATGAAFGVSLATDIMQFIPGINVVASMASTSILHLVTGSIMIGVFEMMDAGMIDATNLKDSKVTSIINSFAANATTLVGGVFRGDISLHSLNIISNNKTKNLA